MIVGLALALVCAVATSVAFLLKHRGAVLAPDVQVRHPLRSAADLFRSKWFAIGWAVALGAWGLHVGALALAPLSIVQAVLSGGLVFLRRRRPAGLRRGGFDRDRVRRPRRRRCDRRSRDPPSRPLSGPGPAPRRRRRRAVRCVSPWSAAALIASVVAFYASARGLQIGPGVEVIALTSVAANLTAIVGGILVFRDPIGTGALEISGRMLAFCLVIAGAALIPAPVRATNAASDASDGPSTHGSGADR